MVLQILEFHHLHRPGKASSQASLRDSTASLPASGAPTPRAATALRRGAMDLLLNTQSSAWSDASSGGGGGRGGDTHSVGSVPPRAAERASMEAQSFRELAGLEGRPPREPSRPELALCVLSELAYEHDEDFRVHLPLLLHVVALNADSGDAAVRLESCQLLVYLLHSLACRHLAAQASGEGAPPRLAALHCWRPACRARVKLCRMGPWNQWTRPIFPAGTSSPEYLKASGLITRLQTLHGQPLWPREQPSLAAPQVESGASVAVFAQTVVECFYFDSDLRERWCAEALKWACGARCRHFASRSHQLFCALHPALSSASCTAMLAALLNCLHNDDAQVGRRRGGCAMLCDCPASSALMVSPTPHAEPGHRGGDPVHAARAADEPGAEQGAALPAAAHGQPGPAHQQRGPHRGAHHAHPAPGERGWERPFRLSTLCHLSRSPSLLSLFAWHANLALLIPLARPLPALQLLDDTDLSDLTVQNTLLSVLPLPDDPRGADENARPSNGGEQQRRPGVLDLPDSAWPLGQGLFSGVAEVDDEAMGLWIAVQQLAVKGLFQPETELLALDVFAAIAKQLASGAARSLARSSAGLFSTMSLAEGLSTGKGASPQGEGSRMALVPFLSSATQS